MYRSSCLDNKVIALSISNTDEEMEVMGSRNHVSRLPVHFRYRQFSRPFDKIDHLCTPYYLSVKLNAILGHIHRHFCRSGEVQAHSPDLIRKAPLGLLEYTRDEMDRKLRHTLTLRSTDPYNILSWNLPVRFDFRRSRSSGNFWGRWPRWTTWQCAVDSSM